METSTKSAKVERFNSVDLICKAKKDFNVTSSLILPFSFPYRSIAN